MFDLVIVLSNEDEVAILENASEAAISRAVSRACNYGFITVTAEEGIYHYPMGQIMYFLSRESEGTPEPKPTVVEQQELEQVEENEFPNA